MLMPTDKEMAFGGIARCTVALVLMSGYAALVKRDYGPLQVISFFSAVVASIFVLMYGGGFLIMGLKAMGAPLP